MESGDIFLKYGGYKETFVHPIVFAVTIIAGVLIILLPRKSVLVPFLFVVLLTPLRQRVLIADFNFMMFRILILFGWIRLIVRSELSDLKVNILDKIIIAYVLINVLIFSLQWWDIGAFVNRLGFMYSTLGTYFLFRYFIRDFDDINKINKVLIFICTIIAFFMIAEQLTGQNAFSMFGGVARYTAIREGRLRSMGAFSHPILAGTFGAVLFPLFISIYYKGDRIEKIYGVLGGISTTMVMVTSASAGPLIAYAGGIAALLMWPIRGRMRVVRWGILLLILSLHIVMKAPVWALIDRVSLVPGGSSYHRFMLVNEFIKRFSEWWLLGVRSTSHWGWMMWDTSNQFVQEGVDGGIFGFIFFISIIYVAFRFIGLSLKGIGQEQNKIKYRIWALGSTCFAIIVGFMGITYFDQMGIIFWLLMASIASIYNQYCVLENTDI